MSEVPNANSIYEVLDSRSDHSPAAHNTRASSSAQTSMGQSYSRPNGGSSPHDLRSTQHARVLPSTGDLTEDSRILSLQQSIKDLKQNNQNLKFRNRSLVEQYNRHLDNLSEENDQLRRSIRNAQARAKQTDAEMDDLRQEILTYKKVIANTGQTTASMTDQDIQTNMNTLFYMIQEWAVDIVRETKLGKQHIDYRTSNRLRRSLSEHCKTHRLQLRRGKMARWLGASISQQDQRVPREDLRCHHHEDSHRIVQQRTLLWRMLR